MSSFLDLNFLRYLEIKDKDLFPFIFLTCIGLFPCMPPAIQSLSIVLFFISALFFYWTHIKINTKKKLTVYFILTGYYYFSLITYFWSSDTHQFKSEIQSNISLILIPFISIFFLPKLSRKYLHFFLLCLVFSFFIYLIIWYQYIVDGIIIFQKYNYGTTEFADKSSIDRLHFLIIEFITKHTSYSQLGMDGYHYFAPHLHKDFFVHHSYTSALALICILINVYYIRISNNFLKIILGSFIFIFSLYIFYVDSQINKFLYILFILIAVTWLLYKKWNYSPFIILGFIAAFLFFNKDKIIPRLNHIVITTENTKDNNQGVDYVRYSLYKKAYQLFQENKTLGLGLGDYKTELNHNLKLSNTQYNSHSQFIYYLLVGGILNLTLFLISLSYIANHLIKHRDLFLFLFFSVCISNFLFENFLNRLWGVLIYNIFIILFVNEYLDSDE